MYTIRTTEGQQLYHTNSLPLIFKNKESVETSINNHHLMNICIIKIDDKKTENKSKQKNRKFVIKGEIILEFNTHNKIWQHKENKKKVWNILVDRLQMIYTTFRSLE